MFRAALIADGAFEFTSDEAVVGLMARHINHGHAIPTFYYGQDYMGSLEAIVVAAGYRLLGESVTTIRLLQLTLYCAALTAGYLLALVVTGSRRIAAISLLLLAFPTAMGTTYTSIAIGGYNEVLILSSVVLLLGWQVTIGQRKDAWRWMGLGVAAGLGWWVNGAIITALLVVSLTGLWYLSCRNLRLYGMALVGFMLGSAPWWLYNLQYDWAALGFLLEGYGSAPGEVPPSTVESLIALLVLGFPALYGLRYPWEPGLLVTVSTLLGGMVYLVLITGGLAGWLAHVRVRRSIKPDGLERVRRWLWLVFGVFSLIFVLSSFADATGRYLTPLWVPAAIGIALGLERLRRSRRALATTALALLLVMHTSTVLLAARSESGLTQQLVARLRVPAEYDAALLEWLDEEDITHGYASYWTAFRITFLSGEHVVLDSSLPYNEKGYQPRDNRYSPYAAAVRDADDVVWITQNFPALDTLIEQRFAEAKIAFRTRDFGPYRLYFDLSQRVGPLDLGLDSTEANAALRE